MWRLLIDTYDDSRRCGLRGPSYCVPFLSSLDAGTITPFPFRSDRTSHKLRSCPQDLGTSFCLLHERIHYTRRDLDTVFAHIVFLRRVIRALFTANVVPSSPILVTLMMKAIHSSETSVLRRAHGVTYQKTEFFIVTAVKNSKLT
jgi:hypothetical protein